MDYSSRITAAQLVDYNVPGAAATWNWLKTNVYDKVRVTDIAADPKFHLVPRTDSNTLPPISTYIPPSPVVSTRPTAGQTRSTRKMGRGLINDLSIRTTRSSTSQLVAAISMRS
jgi:hypothetical protein